MTDDLRDRLLIPAANLNAINDLLGRLGDKLLAPIWQKLSRVDTLSIIPHGPLHALPFHALRQGGRFLIETHAVSYAPSAAVLNYCWNKPSTRSPEQPFEGIPLLVGVPDERATQVSQEIQALADIENSSSLLSTAIHSLLGLDVVNRLETEARSGHQGRLGDGQFRVQNLLHKFPNIHLFAGLQQIFCPLLECNAFHYQLGW